MLELPEIATLSRQIDDALVGTTIESANCGNAQHKWAFYSRPKEDFGAMLAGSAIQGVSAGGKFVYVSLSSERVLTLGGMGGRILLHEPGSRLPKRHHFAARLADGRTLTVAIQGWGFINLFRKDEVSKHRYAGNIKPSLLGKSFTYDRFKKILDSVSDQEKLVAKKLLVSDPRFPGISNGYLQDILFHAGIHHTRRVVDIKGRERQKLYNGIRKVLKEATDKGGKDEERDLYGQPGGYPRILNAKAKGKPCPVCGTKIEKIQFLGGASYFCPRCQT